jgi:hypothetical protein
MTFDHCTIALLPLPGALRLIFPSDESNVQELDFSLETKYHSAVVFESSGANEREFNYFYLPPQYPSDLVLLSEEKRAKILILYATFSFGKFSI